jgi:hypothetical protein
MVDIAKLLEMSEPRPQSPPPPAKPTNVPPPGSVPKLPQTIFNLEKRGGAVPPRAPRPSSGK